MTAEVGSFSQNDDNYQWFIEEINVQNMKQFTKRTYKGLGMTKEKIQHFLSQSPMSHMAKTSDIFWKKLEAKYIKVKWKTINNNIQSVYNGQNSNISGQSLRYNYSLNYPRAVGEVNCCWWQK